MRAIIVIMAIWAATAQAQAPVTVVAVTSWPNMTRVTLLSESCGWPGGAMRGQQILPGRQVRWGCWGYNETGVQMLWQDGATEHIPFQELITWRGNRWLQVSYPGLHDQVLRAHNTR